VFFLYIFFNLREFFCACIFPAFVAIFNFPVLCIVTIASVDQYVLAAIRPALFWLEADFVGSQLN